MHKFLSNRTFTVVHGNSECIRRPIFAGVPRGSLLGPIIFNIYINDTENDNNVNGLKNLLKIRMFTVRSGSVKLAVNKLCRIKNFGILICKMKD
jgi:hypothetical protein